MCREGAGSVAHSGGRSLLFCICKGGVPMYQALYRKYRPKTFSEVVGQQHITDTLQRQVVGLYWCGFSNYGEQLP